MRDLEDTYWWYPARSEIISDVVGRFIPPGSRLLDFGAGAGGMAKRLRDGGYEIVAADVSPDALAACRKLGLQTLDLRSAWPAPETFDCILACDVLEHVEEDVELLRKFEGMLHEGGWLIVAVPAYDFLWSGEDYVSDHV